MTQKKPLTRDGYLRLAGEYNHLLYTERPKVVDGIATAAAEGDRSENAEYIYGKKRLRELDKRLKYLSYLLKDVEVADPDLMGGSRITFGATATCEDENGKEYTWTIVGEGEARHEHGEISWKSPVARALLGREVGDEVRVKRPNGWIELEVTNLQFPSKRMA